MIVLGIDPGSRHTGYGVLDVSGKRERIIEYGVLHLGSEASHQLRLKRVYDRVTEVLGRVCPDE